MSITFKKALLAAGLAAALVGCGGGSSTTSMMPQEPSGPTPEETKSRQLKAITDAEATAKMVISGIDNKSTDPEVKDADDALMALKNAIDGAEALSEAEKKSPNGLYESHKETLDERKGMRTAYREQKEQQMIDETTAEAMKWQTAITSYGKVPKTAAGLAAPLAGDLMVDYKDGSTQIALDNKNGIALTPMDSMPPAEGWTAKRFGEEDKSRGVIITNRVGPETTMDRMGFLEFFFNEDSATPGQYVPKTGDDSHITNLVATGASTLRERLFKDINFQRGGSNRAVLQNNYFADRPGPLGAGESKQVTFLGMEGTLKCSGTDDCTIQYTPSGTFTYNAGDVVFIPDGSIEDLIVRRPKTDLNEDYLTFGYWITTTGSGSSMRHMIDTHAAATGYATAIEDPSTLVGSATYSGGAAGVYVLKTGDIGNDPDLHHGEFVANASLTARFTDLSGTRSAKDEWIITGTIDGFKSVTMSEHDLSKWDLELSASLAETRANNVVLVDNRPTRWGLFNPVTKGNDSDGSWQAHFYGNSGRRTTDAASVNKRALGIPDSATPEVTVDDHPEAIVGEFDGHFRNGHVAGAFGVEKD